MTTRAARWIIAAAALLALPALSSAASIECSKVGTSYDSLFADGQKRVEAILADFKGLPKNANEQQKDQIRKRFCAAGGEIVGYYKFIQAVANDCKSRGENMDNLLKVVNEQLGLAQKGVAGPCS